MQKSVGGCADIVKGELCTFRHGAYSAAMNMAIDDLLFRRAEKTGKFFLRFYDFLKPSVILASSDSAENFIGNPENVELTRRISGGKPIYVDNSVVSYSITGPSLEANGFSSTSYVHKVFGGLVAKAIGDFIIWESIEKSIHSTVDNGSAISLLRFASGKPQLELGKAYSIRFNGLPLAGHGQYLSLGKAFLYHGVISVSPWDIKGITSSIRLRREDTEMLASLPSLSHIINKPPFHVLKAQFTQMLKESIERNFEHSEEMSAYDKGELVTQAYHLCNTKYSAGSWIYRTDVKLSTDSRFCLLYEG